MNNTNNYPISVLCEGVYNRYFSIKADTTVEQFKNHESYFQYSLVSNKHRLWGETFVFAIECNNKQVVSYIVETCGKEIFARHVSASSCEVPLRFVRTAKMTQLLINLGADVNINYNHEDLECTINFGKRYSPLLMVLSNKDNKIDQSSLVKITKCFIRNGAVISEEDKNTSKKLEIISLALKEIEDEDKKFQGRGIVFLSALQDQESIVFKSGMNHDIISFICQKIIETHLFEFYNP